MKRRSPRRAPPGNPVSAGPTPSADAEFAARLQTALAMHQRGELDQAAAIYTEILRSQPHHFDALQLLATIAAQRRNSAAAVELFDQALRIAPNHVGSLVNRGAALQDLQRLAEAVASYDRALQVAPDHLVALNNRGVALRDLQRPLEALASFERALRIKPDYADALNNRGNALRDLQRPQEALACYERVLAAAPDRADVHYNRGCALQDLDRLAEAVQSHDRALGINPDHADALFERGNALQGLKRSAEALASYDRALGIRPDHAPALNNRGVALRDMQRLDEALASYDRALRIAPHYADAHYNRAVALQDMNRVDEALAGHERALQLDPDHAQAHFSAGLCRLVRADFARGWREYEWRWKKEPGLSMSRNFAQPLWLGREDLRNKTILLHHEQGLGDTIQFCRYARQVAALGARVMLEVQPQLKTLLQGLAGAAVVVGRGEKLPDFDFHCPLLSLPLAFGADLGNISGAAYLQSNPLKVEAWRSRLAATGRRRVGLVWSGSTEHDNDHNRSIALTDFQTLFTARAECYCLQKELRPADRPLLEQNRNIRFLGSDLGDFSDTAAVVELMDLVITVDTSVAHLAGALGKPVWILLPFRPDWRWLLKRSDSPWYRSAKLFRQPRIGDWQSVLHEVKAAAGLA